MIVGSTDNSWYRIESTTCSVWMIHWGNECTLRVSGGKTVGYLVVHGQDLVLHVCLKLLDSWRFVSYTSTGCWIYGCGAAFLEDFSNNAAYNEAISVVISNVGSYLNWGELWGLVVESQFSKNEGSFTGTHHLDAQLPRNGWWNMGNYLLRISRKNHP